MFLIKWSVSHTIKKGGGGDVTISSGGIQFQRVGVLTCLHTQSCSQYYKLSETN